MLKNILENITTANPKFDGTPYQNWSSTPPARKGKIGEEVARCILTQGGHKVEDREAKTHDIVLNGKKTEIKTAFEARDKDDFMVYGYDPTSDASYWLVQLVKPTGISAYLLDRKNWSNLYIKKSGGGGTLTSFTEDRMEECGAQLLYAVVE